jgi:hypothetical protein
MKASVTFWSGLSSVGKRLIGRERPGVVNWRWDHGAEDDGRRQNVPPRHANTGCKPLPQSPTRLLRKFRPTVDVHDNSGIPNKAFAVSVQAVGGKAWERALKVWYAACTGNLSSSATLVEFARATIAAAHREGGDDLAKQAAQAWQRVELPLPVA